MAETQIGDRPAMNPPGGWQLPAAACCLGILSGAIALLAAPAQAQSSACDQLKRVLATRLAGDPRSYTLEAVPAGTPLPPGGQFIGNCEGGTRKILYRRGTAAQPASTPDVPKPAAPAPPPTRGVVAPIPALRAADVDAASAVPPKENPADMAARPAPLAEPPQETIFWRQWAAEFTMGRWVWIWALLGVPIAWGAWAWWAHRRAFDAAGLPRGPRL